MRRPPGTLVIVGVSRLLVLDVSTLWFTRPLRPAITKSFEKENARTLAALKSFAEA